jgi:pSer/pThr/pTyr-binding forkhead associated (FHA) protein
MPHLVLTHPGHDSRILPLKGPFKVGRAPDNDLVIVDMRMSRYHVRFERTERGWEVFDNGSTSGILVNDSRAGSSKVLADGDVIHFGGIYLTYSAEE